MSIQEITAVASSQNDVDKFARAHETAIAALKAAHEVSIAALKASHETSTNVLMSANALIKDNVEKHLAEVNNHLAALNGKAYRNESWILAREPVCEQMTENMKSVTSAVTTITRWMDLEEGARKSTRRWALAINAVVALAIGFGSMWFAMQAAIASFHLAGK